MKKVCILTSVHPPFDGRIFHKEAKTLKKAGYNVVLIAQHNRKETIDGIRIIPLPKPKNRFDRITKVAWRLFILALKEKAYVYHFHDPELISIGLILRLFGKKVIYDVHEDVSEQILYKDWVGNPIARKIVSFIFNGFEGLSCIFLDGIIAATPDIAGKFSSNKAVSLKNLPILELIDKAKPLSINKHKSIIIYAGGLTRIRGIKEIIQAMQFIGDKAELWLLGEWENEEFKKECKSPEGWKYTKYLGLKPLEKVYSYMKVANIGISILYPVKNYVTSLPIKAFEYMACSLPMVMSNFPYWQKIFRECALFVDSYNPEDIAEKILYLLNNPEKIRKLGEQGRKLIEKKYNWETESKKLTKLYGELLKNE